MQKQAFKDLITVFLGIITVHGWYMSKVQHEAAKEAAKNKELLETLKSKMTELDSERLQHYIDTSLFRSKSVALQGELNKSLEDALAHQKLYEQTGNEYHLEQVKTSVFGKLNELKSYNEWLYQQNDRIVQDIEDNNLTNKNGNSLSDSAPDINLESPSESNIFGTVQDFIDQYYQFLSTLTPEQHALLFNSLAIILILTNINSLVAIFYGDKLIKFLKLEEKYPRLKKWIEYRRNFTNYFFKYNLFFIYLIIFSALAVNIFMFLI